MNRNFADTPGGVRTATAPAVAAALCATFGTGFAQAAPIIVDIDPDVTLGTYALDVDQNGSTDFTFSRADSCLGPACFSTNSVVGASGNAVAKSDAIYAEALGAGEIVDGTRTYSTGSQVLSSTDPIKNAGQFYDAGLAYVGIRFDMGAPGPLTSHYGWVEVLGSGVDITLTRFGYETTADTGIRTPAAVPEPGTLALLAAGAIGVAALRRRARR